MVSHPELGSDPPIGSDLESGCDTFAFLYLYPIMRSSSGSIRSVGLHIGGRLAERAESEQVGGGSGRLPSAAARALLVGHPLLLGKGKERISEIIYPTGSEYLRAAVRCSDQWALFESSPHMRKFLPRAIDLRLVSMFGVQTFSHLTSSMFLRWLAFLRRPLKMVSASLYTLSSSASFSTSTYAHPSFPPISRAFWLASLLFSRIKAWGFPA